MTPTTQGQAPDFVIVPQGSVWYLGAQTSPARDRLLSFEEYHIATKWRDGILLPPLIARALTARLRNEGWTVTQTASPTPPSAGDVVRVEKQDSAADHIRYALQILKDGVDVEAIRTQLVLALADLGIETHLSQPEPTP